MTQNININTVIAVKNIAAISGVPCFGYELPYSNTFNNNPFGEGWTKEENYTWPAGEGVWQWKDTSYAGGQYPEMSIEFTQLATPTDAYSRLITGAVNTCGKTSVNCVFNLNLQLYSPPSGLEFRLRTSPDKVNWTIEYSRNYTTNEGVEVLSIPCDDNVGSVLYFAFELVGDMNRLGNNCSIDNLVIS